MKTKFATIAAVLLLLFGLTRGAVSPGNSNGGSSRLVSTADTATASANTDAVITYASASSMSNVVSEISFSYTGTATTGGFVTISDGSNVVYKVGVTVNGAGQFVFSNPKRGTVNTAMTITLTAGGSGAIGWINATHWTE